MDEGKVERGTKKGWKGKEREGKREERGGDPARSRYDPA